MTKVSTTPPIHINTHQQHINRQQYQSIQETIDNNQYQSIKQLIHNNTLIDRSIDQAVMEIDQRMDGSEENKTRNKP